MRKRLITLGYLVFILITLSMVFTISSAQNFGSNWSGKYYDCRNQDCDSEFTRTDDEINFFWGDGGPDNGLDDDNFSVRWTGTQNFSQSGTYEFIAAFNDELKVSIDGTTIINKGDPASITVNYDITAGSHTIIVEYTERTKEAFVQFQWQLVGAAGPTVTPGPSPTPGPTNTPAPTGLPPLRGGVTATVIKAAVLNVRDAPTLGSNVIGRILKGQTYNVVGRNSNATWFLLQLSNMQAWAWGYYLYIDGNEFNPPIVSAGNTLGLAGAPDYGVVARTVATMKLRAAPNVASAQIGRVTWGALVPVIGRTADGYWWKIVWKNTQGWVYSPYLKLFQGNINSVPVE